MSVLTALGLLVVSLIVGDGVGATLAGMTAPAAGPEAGAGVPMPDEPRAEVSNVPQA